MMSHIIMPLRYSGLHKTIHILTKKRFLSKQSYSRPIILGIETSCDDTGCAIINNAGEILGQSLHSQNAIHVRYGGVNPIIAHELHTNNIESAVKECIQESRLNLNDIDAIAVTTKPGLLLSLQVGVKYARYLARKHDKPLIPIHHMEAHALIVRMYQNIQPPFLVLLISGGHCLLAVVEDINQFLLLGESLDNAPGEVFDKVARRMKLKNIPIYSKIAGGKAIELAARKSSNRTLFAFPTPLARYRDCNFSFSGLMESCLHTLRLKEAEHGIMGDGIIPEINDLCAAFQLAMTEHIMHRTERAMLLCEKKNLISGENKNLVVSGGVACNDFIFKAVEIIGNKLGHQVHRPPPKLCTDNGVMIAWNGLEKYRKQCDIMLDFPLKEVTPEAPLGKNYINEVKLCNIPVRATRLKKLCAS